MPATIRTRPDPLRHLRHITPRDRLLLSWLAEHHTLTTAQIATALFPSLRAAQKRLTLLYRIERRRPVRLRPHRHRHRRPALHPRTSRRPPVPTAGGRRSLLARRAEIARNPKLDHLLGVNGFFTDLHGHARTHPGSHLAPLVGRSPGHRRLRPRRYPPRRTRHLARRRPHRRILPRTRPRHRSTARRHRETPRLPAPRRRRPPLPGTHPPTHRRPGNQPAPPARRHQPDRAGSHRHPRHRPRRTSLGPDRSAQRPPDPTAATRAAQRPRPGRHQQPTPLPPAVNPTAAAV